MALSNSRGIGGGAYQESLGFGMKGISHHLESIITRYTCGATTVALRPTTTFTNQPVANVATLPRARESTAGVPRLKDQKPLGLVEQGTKNLYTADSGMDSVKE